MPDPLAPGLPCRRCGRTRQNRLARYCDVCGAARRRERARQQEARRPWRPDPAHRGYGAEHRALRAQWLPLVAAGGVRCARCRKPIVPGQPWDLGHDDADRTQYAGPEHAAARDCTEGGNRATQTPGRATARSTSRT